MARKTSTSNTTDADKLPQARQKLIAACGIAKNIVHVNAQADVLPDTYEALLLLVTDFYEAVIDVSGRVDLEEILTTDFYAAAEGVIKLLQMIGDVENSEDTEPSEEIFHLVHFVLNKLNHMTDDLDGIAGRLRDVEATT